MARDFHPRGVGAILDDAIAVYRANWRLLLPLAAIVVLPAAIVYSILASFYLRSVFETIASVIASAPTGGLPAAPSTLTTLVGTLTSGFELVFLLASAYLTATLFSIAGQLLQGVRPTVKDALKAGGRAFVPLIVVQMLAAFIVGLAGLLSFWALGLGAAVAGVLLSMAGPVVVIEGGIGTAFGRSYNLVKRNFWRVLVIVGGAALISTQFESALATPLLIREVVFGVQQNPITTQLAWGWKVFDGVVQGLAISLVLPFTQFVTVLTYLDLRAREEGMDLVVRARALLASR